MKYMPALHIHHKTSLHLPKMGKFAILHSFCGNQSIKFSGYI